MFFIFRKKVYVLIFFVLLLYVLYKSFIKTGYNQAILIEDIYWGVEKKIIPPDSFSFVFRNVIPNRIKFHSIIYKSQQLKFIYLYPLASNAILGLDDSFSIKLDLVYIYDLDLKKLSDLFIKLPNKRWEDLNSYLEIKLKDLLYESLKEKLKIEERLENGEEILKAYIHNGFLQEINKNFEVDGIYFRNIYIQDIYVPDVVQYNIVLKQGQKFLEKKLERSAMIDEAKAKKESNLILFDYEKKRLEDLANLIRKYPELKEYLKIEKMSSQAQFIYIPTDSFWYGNSNYKALLPQVENHSTKPKENKHFSEVEKNQRTFIDKTPP